MTTYGYTLMTEQSGPVDLVRYAQAAERAGFDFEVMSDHFSPWLDSQGHAPNAWTTLGAVAQATERVELMTYVTCPIMRYHPAVVAQQAATIGLLSDGRFLLGLGAGENLNEHVVGRGWPAANVRHEMFDEAVHIIRELFAGEYVNFAGKHFRVDSAKLWDVADQPPPIGLAISGAQSATLAGELADAMIAVEPDADLVAQFDKHGGQGKRRIGQVPICWDRSKDAAIERAHDQFRWFGSGWKVNAELPGTAAFAGASQFVRPEDVADSIPCGPDVAAHVDAVREFEKAGFTDIAVVQVGERESAGVPRVGAAGVPAGAARLMTTGVVFDVDGTLVDTTFIHTVCWADALATGGHTGADGHHPPRDRHGIERVARLPGSGPRHERGREDRDGPAGAVPPVLGTARAPSPRRRTCCARAPSAGTRSCSPRPRRPTSSRPCDRRWTPTTSSTSPPARPMPRAANPLRTSSRPRSSSRVSTQNPPCSSAIRCGMPRRRRRRASRS